MRCWGVQLVSLVNGWQASKQSNAAHARLFSILRTEQAWSRPRAAYQWAPQAESPTTRYASQPFVWGQQRSMLNQTQPAPNTASQLQSPPDPKDQFRQYWRLPGKITARYTVPYSPVFAVVEVGPAQFKVSPNDVLHVEKLKAVDINDKVALGRVLMMGSLHETVIGRPYIPDAEVIAAVEEQFQDAKVIVFKKKRRKNFKQTKGHRQVLTTLRILEIKGISADGPVGGEPEEEESSKQQPSNLARSE